MLYVEPGYWRSGYVQEDSDTIRSCRFDGHGKFIFISEIAGQIDVADIYSEWKEWASYNWTDDYNMKWPIAMRYSGTDPIPGGFTGATFFMINGWRLVYNENSTAVSGVLFSEDYSTAYWNTAIQPIYPVTVSAVVNQVTTTQNVVTGDLQAAIEAIISGVWANNKALSVPKYLGLK